MEDVDRFMRESSKSYKECRVKNSARRNSLMKKSLSIDVERKMASSVRSREEKQLRDQLKLMRIDRTKTAIMSSIRDRSNSKSKSKDSEADSKRSEDLNLDPYPVTFGHHTPIIRSRANTMDNKGKAFAARRGRRQSKEFEDLHVNTSTGTLALSRLHALALGSPSGSPSTLSPASPGQGRHGSSGSFSPAGSPSRRRLGSTSSSTGSPSGDREAVWAGDPQAIGSVRRPRKSVEEQEWDRLARREARLNSDHSDH